MHRRMIEVSLMALFCLAAVSAFAGDKAEVKGMITARTGETLIVKSGEGSTTVVLTDDTKTKDEGGSLAWTSSICPMWCLSPDSRWTLMERPTSKAGW